MMLNESQTLHPWVGAKMQHLNDSLHLPCIKSGGITGRSAPMTSLLEVWEAVSISTWQTSEMAFQSHCEPTWGTARRRRGLAEGDTAHSNTTSVCSHWVAMEMFTSAGSISVFWPHSQLEACMTRVTGQGSNVELEGRGLGRTSVSQV